MTAKKTKLVKKAKPKAKSKAHPHEVEEDPDEFEEVEEELTEEEESMATPLTPPVPPPLTPFRGETPPDEFVPPPSDVPVADHVYDQSGCSGDAGTTTPLGEEPPPTVPPLLTHPGNLDNGAAG